MGINTTIAGNSLGAMPLIIAGTEEQKKKYLGRLLARKPIFAAYACSEPDAGSRRRRHEEPLPRRWATTTCSPARSAGSPTAAWPTSTRPSRASKAPSGTRASPASSSTATRPGVKVGKKENKMGQRASQHHRRHLRGREAHQERTWSATRATASRSPCRPSTARAPGSPPAPPASSAARSTSRRHYALERKTFGVPIAQHQAVQFMLAEMAIAYEATRLLYHKAAWSIDSGQPGQHRLELRQGLRRRRRHAGGHRRRPDLRRLRLHQGVPGREAHARRQAAADLRGHQRRSSAWSSPGTCWARSSSAPLRPTLAPSPPRPLAPSPPRPLAPSPSPPHPARGFVIAGPRSWKGPLRSGGRGGACRPPRGALTRYALGPSAALASSPQTARSRPRLVGRQAPPLPLRSLRSRCFASARRSTNRTPCRARRCRSPWRP